jgi:transglutaminase-like putative cysteine protease
MRIRIGHDLVFEVPRPTPMLLMLYVRPDVAGALQEPECITVEPAAPVESFVDWLGNRAARIEAPRGRSPVLATHQERLRRLHRAPGRLARLPARGHHLPAR